MLREKLIPIQSEPGHSFIFHERITLESTVSLLTDLENAFVPFERNSKPALLLMNILIARILTNQTL